MQRPLMLLSLATILGACAAPLPTEASGATGSAIIGGSIDKADPAIVELIMETGDDGGTCTATFISQTVLLTAAHCVVDENNPKVIPTNATFKVMLAPSATTAKTTDFITVPRANVHFHPQYDGNGAHDVAIVVLDQPVSVTPIPIGRTALTQADVGKRVRIVGYGMSKRVESDNDGSETKRTVTTAIMSLQGDLVGIGSSNGQACNGDSGGPALLSIDGVETLIATDDLAAMATNCAGGDLYQRTDLHLDFIDQFLNGGVVTDPTQTTVGDTGATDTGTDGTDTGTTDPCQDPNTDAFWDETQCPIDGTQAG